MLEKAEFALPPLLFPAATAEVKPAAAAAANQESRLLINGADGW